MALSHRPINHTERDLVSVAIADFVEDGTSDPNLVGIEQLTFRAARVAFGAERAAFLKVAGLEREASGAADAADAGFDTAFRVYTGGVRHPDGKAATDVMTAAMDGTTPGELVRQPYREEVEKSGRMLDKLAARTDLRTNAEDREALVVARDELAEATTADETAVREKLAAGQRMEEATIAFDRTYGKFVRAFLSLADEATGKRVLPTFVRPEDGPLPKG